MSHSTITEADLKRFYELTKQKREIEREIEQLKRHFHLVFDKTVGENEKANMTCGLYHIQRQIRQTTRYHPERTVQKLEDLQLSDFIDIIKQPNTNKLTAAIRLGLVDEHAFDDCRETKLTQAITVRLIDE